MKNCDIVGKYIGSNIQRSKRKFVGPKALFDPFFIPDILFDREIEERNLHGLLLDALSDNFPASISLYGIEGVGKTTLVNKTLDMLSKPSMNFFEYEIVKLMISCDGKNTNQLTFSILNSLANAYTSLIDPNFLINPENVLNYNNGEMWNLIEMLLSKMDSFPKVLFFDSAEVIDSKYLNNISKKSVSDSFIMISSFNLPQCSPYLSNFYKSDYKIQMDTYSNDTLLNISKNRCEIAIHNPVNEDIIKYMVDLVGYFDKNVPGSCIKILRELYPMLERSDELNSLQIRDICRYQFEGFTIDELDIAAFIYESDILDRVFMDNICSFFDDSKLKFYINYENLLEFYKMACESIDFSFKMSDFKKTLIRLYDICLLMPTKLNNSPQKLISNNDNERRSIKTGRPFNSNTVFFLTISSELLKEMLDVAFGDVYN